MSGGRLVACVCGRVLIYGQTCTCGRNLIDDPMTEAERSLMAIFGKPNNPDEPEADR